MQETIDGDSLAQNIDYMVDKTIQKISDEAAQKERENKNKRTVSDTLKRIKKQ